MRISPSGTELKGDLFAVSRFMMRHANRGGSRAQFLRKASDAILAFTVADRLDLWLDDNEQRYHWSAQRRCADSAAKMVLSTKSVQQRLSSLDSSVNGRKLIDSVLDVLNATGDRHPEPRNLSPDSVCLGDKVVIPFEIDKNNDGVIVLENAEIDPSDPQQVDACEDMAQLLGVAISNRRAKAALLERVKELTCMYKIAHIAAGTHTGTDDIFDEIVDLLPQALQYPDIASARIVVEDKTFQTTDFAKGPYRLASDLFSRNKKAGHIEVFYSKTPEATLDDDQVPMEPAFLTEEHHLIDGVARELNAIIERDNVQQEKHQLESQVRHANRLVTIGELAAGVAHELNEPLGSILGFAQLVRKSPELSHPILDDIKKIEKASLYAREIVKKLMFFARQAPSKKTGVNLNEVVEDSLVFLESRCDTAAIKVVRNLHPSLPVLHGDPAQLQQVLVNLIVNAMQSMPEGGTLTITTSNVGDGQRLAVKDTGTGISADNIKRIFLPFFTTKEVGEGTGLGLSVVHGIVTAHGGTVDVASTLGEGSLFTVEFPAQDPSSRHVEDING